MGEADVGRGSRSNDSISCEETAGGTVATVPRKGTLTFCTEPESLLRSWQQRHLRGLCAGALDVDLVDAEARRYALRGEQRVQHVCEILCVADRLQKRLREGVQRVQILLRGPLQPLHDGRVRC